jgi:protein phosphatase
VELMTSGAFARASGLSRKALRLYDELGLLHPARVDPATLYRFYDPRQLEQARLVAWLRRLGMPLAAIRSVTGLPPARAAEELAAYWAKAEAETAARRELAVFLIGYLSGKDPGKDRAMSENQGTLTVRYGVRSDIGLHREDNEDAAYAGDRLLAVADGMGGHAIGEMASAAVIDALRPLDTRVPAGELLNALDHAVRRADGALRDMVQADPSLEGMGTTLTALLWSGSQLGLVHIGDSRAYLVRDGEVFQITQDHTLVQSLLDDGKITAEEVTSHPQRLLLHRPAQLPARPPAPRGPGRRPLPALLRRPACGRARRCHRAGPAHRARPRPGRRGSGGPGPGRRRPGQHHLHRRRRRHLDSAEHLSPSRRAGQVTAVSSVPQAHQKSPQQAGRSGSRGYPS